MEQEAERELTELERRAIKVWPLIWTESPDNWLMTSIGGMNIHVKRYPALDKHYWSAKVIIGEHLIYHSNSHPDAEAAILAAYHGWRGWASGVPALAGEKQRFEAQVLEQLQLLVDASRHDLVSRLQATERERDALAAWVCESCRARFPEPVSPVLLDGVRRCSTCCKVEALRGALAQAQADNAALLAVLQAADPLLTELVTPGEPEEEISPELLEAHTLIWNAVQREHSGAGLLARLQKAEAAYGALAVLVQSVWVLSQLIVSPRDRQGLCIYCYAADTDHADTCNFKAANRAVMTDLRAADRVLEAATQAGVKIPVAGARRRSERTESAFAELWDVLEEAGTLAGVGQRFAEKLDRAERVLAALMERLDRAEDNLNVLVAAAESYISGEDAAGWERLTQAIDRARGRAVSSEAANGQ